MKNDRDTVKLQELEDRSDLAHSNGEYTFYDKEGK